MRKITYICDKCGKEIKAVIIEMQAGQIDMESENWERMPEVKIHFHLSCMDKMMNDLRRKEEPKNEAKKTEKKGPHNPVDRNTVKALKEAGWTAKEIAEDEKIRCAESTVCKIIKELEEEGKL